jgi:adenylate cyclase class 2
MAGKKLFAQFYTAFSPTRPFTMEPVEIEVKFHVADPGAMREKIIDQGAQSQGKVFETNSSWDDSAGTISAARSLLRVRHDEKCRLTFKKPSKDMDPGFKIQCETEVEVDDGAALEQILVDMGFHTRHRYQKWRETFVLGRTKIVMDSLPYGDFLELEGDKKAIFSMAQKLGLAWEKRIVLSYLELFEIIKRGERLPFSDATFSHFRKSNVAIEKYLPQFEAGKPEEEEEEEEDEE